MIMIKPGKNRQLSKNTRFGDLPGDSLLVYDLPGATSGMFFLAKCRIFA